MHWGSGTRNPPAAQHFSFTRTQCSRYSDLAKGWKILRWNPNRRKYIPLLHIIQSSSGAHTDLLLINVHRVSSLEIKRPECDVDHFAPPSAHFNLVELHLYSQYTPLFLGHRQLHVFTLPVSSKFTFDQRMWSGLIEIVGCPRKQRASWRANRYSVEKCLGFMKKPQLLPLLSRNLCTLLTRINNWFLSWTKWIYSPNLFPSFLYHPVIILSIPRSTNLSFPFRLTALHFNCVSWYVIHIHVPPS